MKNSMKRLVRKNLWMGIFLGVAFLLQSNSLYAQEATVNYDRISNRWTSAFLHSQYDGVELGEIQTGWWSAMWVIEPVEGTTFVRIKNRWKGTYVHSQYEGVELGEIQPGWWSAMWVLEPVAGTTFVRIKNRWKGTFLHNQNGSLDLGEIEPGWWSAMWTVASIQGEACNCAEKTFRTQSDHSWAEFRLPVAKAGEIIKIKEGAYNKYVYPKCNRVWWSNLIFSCNPDSCEWERIEGKWDADAFCHGFPGDSPYVKVGTRE